MRVGNYLGLIVSLVLLILCLSVSVRSAIRHLRSREHNGQARTAEGGRPLRSLGLSLIAANWFVFASVSFAIGGSALMGEIAGSDYLVRLNTGSSPAAVSRTSWLLSLVHGTVTVGLTPLLLGATILFSTPRRPRGFFEWAAFSFGLFLTLAVVRRAIPMFLDWAGH